MNSIDGVIMLASTNRADILDKVRLYHSSRDLGVVTIFRFFELGLRLGLG